ncbi:mechanosensitive ion channel family protein [Bacillus atrophaeus]|uniref:mechanosensitive ion channel family protein n=1 Tax=Bacillus atrophaeus TaxID=1452 RepID=UPI00227EC199|nr:mechanosensitive ion channel family protein [Bacillus atrophaeus]MCY8511995.1 mechanosensitive ion channel family protein [Bacillus atrophaeus]MCY8515954.1 mechanosensitive ion channel family protein [Bacillus atrophaeus]MCY8993319.1 mechanosensitive ion channel family protein [Bacillus atrophaeus]
MPENLQQYFTLDKTIQIGISVGILLIFLILRKLFTKYLFNLIFNLTNKPKTEIFKQVIVAFDKPVRWFFVALGLFLAIRYSPFFDGQMPLISKVYRSFIVALLSWGLCNLTAASSFLFHKVNQRFDLEMDDILAPFLSKLLRFVIIALSVSVIAQEFNYDVNGFVAGLGLGGLAFALAAKDTISNFFGGIIIITEKPFTIGDWVQTPSVTGTVEDITFRSTRFRTAQEAVVTVPNSTLSMEAITNWTKMNKRQITFSLHVSYATPVEKMDRCIKTLRKMLIEHEGVHDDTIMVNFDMFADNYYNLFFNFYTKTTSWAENLDVREDINYRIIDILAAEGVEFAYPGQTVLVKQKNHNDPFQANRTDREKERA